MMQSVVTIAQLEKKKKKKFDEMINKATPTTTTTYPDDVIINDIYALFDSSIGEADSQFSIRMMGK